MMPSVSLRIGNDPGAGSTRTSSSKPCSTTSSPVSARRNPASTTYVPGGPLSAPPPRGAKKLDNDIDRQEKFLSELRDFEDKLRRAANLHLVPDLNDGVVLNIAPLRELVRWKQAKS
jgi:hypothetical protein